MLEIGSRAPEFALPDQNGKVRRLADHKGKKVILYFYSKDMTAGCTAQACGFRDRYPQILEKGAIVLGVSKDSVKSHKRFEEKHGLPFPLLSDETLEVIAAYDVLKPGRDGKPGAGPIRSTYLIDEDGVIIKACGGVKPKENAGQMLEALSQAGHTEGAV